MKYLWILLLITSCETSPGRPIMMLEDVCRDRDYKLHKDEFLGYCWLEHVSRAETTALPCEAFDKCADINKFLQHPEERRSPAPRPESETPPDEEYPLSGGGG